jgi:spore germination cell wall hydrolase CwlJ-like protein
MNPAAIAGLCTVLAHGGTLDRRPQGVTCTPAAVYAALPESRPASTDLTVPLAAPGARDGLARVAYAEAGNQGDSGLAAVLYAILNRLADGRWGVSVDAVLNARGQFEPVMTAGGDWRRLPPVSAAQQAHVDAILNLIVDGRLPDLTHGALYFQNPKIVASRARAGTVSSQRVNFGGATASAVIGAHSFYVGTRGGASGSQSHGRSAALGSEASIFVGENRADASSAALEGSAIAATTSQARIGDPARALFVGADGTVGADKP